MNSEEKCAYNTGLILKSCLLEVKKTVLLEKSESKDGQRQSKNRQCAADIADE